MKVDQPFSMLDDAAVTHGGRVALQELGWSSVFAD